MTEVVYPNIKPAVAPEGVESYLSVRNVVSVVVVILFVVAMAWLYYKLLDKDKKIHDLESNLKKRMAQSQSPPPDDIESQPPRPIQATKTAGSTPAPTPAPTPVPTAPNSTPAPTPTAHTAIVEGEDDSEVDKYL